MKKLTLLCGIILITALAATGVFGQGTVNFSNASTAIGDTTKLNHWWEPGDPLPADLQPFVPGGGPVPGFPPGGLVSSNAFPSLRAQLYWGASTATSISQLTAVTGPPAFFRSTTSVNVGSWNGGNRTVDQWSAGEHHELAVIVWDSSKAADGLAALQGLPFGTYVGLLGHSSLFDYVVPGILDPPSAALLGNLDGFYVACVACLPEPSGLASGMLGAGILFLLRRRK